MDDKQVNLGELFGIGQSIKSFATYIDRETLEFEPVAGAEIVGKLTDEEKEHYISILGVTGRLDELSEELMATLNVEFAESLLSENGQINERLISKMRGKEIPSDIGNELFWLEALFRMEQSKFWFNVRTRLHTFANRLSIRAGYTVCSIGTKLKLR